MIKVTRRWEKYEGKGVVGCTLRKGKGDPVTTTE